MVGRGEGARRGGGYGMLLELEKEMRIVACLLFLFSRWIVNGLNFCGNVNLPRNTTDGIDYDFCPNNCDYKTPFWGQASSIVSQTKYAHTKNDKCKITEISISDAYANFPFVNGRCHLKRSMPFLKRPS